MLGTLGWPTVLSSIKSDRFSVWGINKDLIKNTVSQSIAQNRYPKRVVVHRNGKEYVSTIQYTIDDKLQKKVESVFKKWQPDYGVFVAIEPDSGRVLAMANHQRNRNVSENLALGNTYPSASIFKLITAAAAIDLGKIDAETIIPFNGKASSLYRKNVLYHKNNKWTQHFPIKTAFAKSANTVFGRLGLMYVGGQQLSEYANKFGFNQQLSGDFYVPESRADFNPEEEWRVVEAAAGYTKNNTISPVHAAMLAASVINGGRMLPPILVDSITNDNGIILYESNLTSPPPIIKSNTVNQLQILMRETVLRGSAQKSFKDFSRKQYKNVEVGGKTGSLSGLKPEGKYDWFIGYAQAGPKKIAFAALCINKDYWYVKSSQVARIAVEHYFQQNQT
ncbi:MAG: hypothetical protein CMQ28_06475 [Gammaproteobacteria bacterium]|nr:hypothetical protein [Gammaproteobacteria bacterium]